jgi:hypothetical protein
MAKQRFVIPLGYLGGAAQGLGEAGQKAEWIKKQSLQTPYALLQYGSEDAATRAKAAPHLEVSSKPGACLCPSAPVEVASALCFILRNLPENASSVEVNTGVDLHEVNHPCRTCEPLPCVPCGYEALLYVPLLYPRNSHARSVNPQLRDRAHYQVVDPETGRTMLDGLREKCYKPASTAKDGECVAHSSPLITTHHH